MPSNSRYKKIALPENEKFEVRYYVSSNADEVPAHSFPPHMHDFIELYILLEGDVSFMVEQNIYPLIPGDVVISRPNELHHCILNSNSLHRHACIWIETDCSILASPFLLRGEGEGSLVRPTEQDAIEVLRIMKDLHANGKGVDTLTGLSLISALLCCVRRNSKTGNIVADPPPQALRTILDDIAENYREIRDLDYFTEKYFISRSTLGRLFRQYLHTTPRLYLEAKRLAHARVLLKSGKSVTDACMESGFCDCSHFIRLFRSRFDITPLQYKNS